MKYTINQKPEEDLENLIVDAGLSPLDANMVRDNIQNIGAEEHNQELGVLEDQIEQLIDRKHDLEKSIEDAQHAIGLMLEAQDPEISLSDLAKDRLSEISDQLYI